jgi:hypothetical protein
LPKQCGGGTGATGCPFSPELRFEICALFTWIGIYNYF